MGLTLSNLFSSLFGKQETKIMMVGLDAAGKTSILYKLKLGTLVTTIPTIGFNLETVEYRNLAFVIWDIGGQHRTRHLYKHYYPSSRAIIFVVDSVDRERITHAQEELQEILDNDELNHLAILVLANKQDLPEAMSPDEVTKQLGLVGQQRPWHVQPTSATRGEGLYEGLDWLSTNINKPTATSQRQPSKAEADAQKGFKAEGSE